MNRFSVSSLIVIGFLSTLVFIPNYSVADFCSIPFSGETEKQLSKEDQKQIPRGTCEVVRILGKLRHEWVNLSLNQTNGSGTLTYCIQPVSFYKKGQFHP